MTADAGRESETPFDAVRRRLRAAVDHLDHVLPGQAPILHFVHHNTLHGFQHLPFNQALEAAERLTGNHAYLSEQEFRRYFSQGRITENDLTAVFERKFGDPAQNRFRIGARNVTRQEVYRIALLFGVDSIVPSRFNWEVEEMDALRRFQPDVSPDQRQQMLGESGIELETVQGLWNACLDLFGLEHYRLHPEELTEIPMQRAKSILDEFAVGAKDASVCSINPGIHREMRAESRMELVSLLGGLGKVCTLRGLLLSLTGVDVLDDVRPLLIRFCASHLDEGLAAWRSPDRADGLYLAWRRAFFGDLSLRLGDMNVARKALADLPEDSADAVAVLLGNSEIPESRWEDYLERLALELPGWSGIVNWRARRPEYPANREVPVSLMDYLAVRLFLDQISIDRLCRETWGVAGKLSSIGAYLEGNLSEFLARLMLFAGELPEYLADAAQELIGLSWTERAHHEKWRVLAEMIWTWKHSAATEKAEVHTVYRSAWRLFRLSQHLGVSASCLRQCSLDEAERLLDLLDKLSPAEKAYLWLQAYENRYREELFSCLSQNHGRGRWGKRESRPRAQFVFCMDDREESIRRHLEETNPAIETLGAAGFFGVPMYWRGLDDSSVTALCPVVVTPVHEVRESPKSGLEELKRTHDLRLARKKGLSRVLYQDIRRNLASSGLLIDVLAPVALASLLGMTFFPRRWDRLLDGAVSSFLPRVPTELQFIARAGSPPATVDHPRVGFTNEEQADRVEGFLRNIGLTDGFAPLVVLAGHGSGSLNNPHLAAYDCGACSGRHGGPNARVFAAMANRPEVRSIVAARGVAIPEDTWFLGAEHNTCNEDMIWFDLDAMPRYFLPLLNGLRADLGKALMLSAHERCRRFASAPPRPSLDEAMKHVAERSADFSQARPELGHATNAAAVVGRRSITRGAFLDRRVFLISYDPTQDTDGRVLEGILLAVGPVGAGINLEYYFSTVNNDHFGCGSKVPHNVAGLFGVMEGASSDLRTGLPLQMVEIHEAMRLQIVCEAREETLLAIYRRQQPLRELIGNGWLLLNAIHPETGALSCFDPSRGFVPWQDEAERLPLVNRSTDWYDGRNDPCPPALIVHPDETEMDRHGA